MLNNCEAKGLGCVLTLPIYRGREQHGNGREAGHKGTGSGRVRYGRREVLTPLSPPLHWFITFQLNNYPHSTNLFKTILFSLLNQCFIFHSNSAF